MYYVSAQSVDEPTINVHYYYYVYVAFHLLVTLSDCQLYSVLC